MDGTPSAKGSWLRFAVPVVILLFAAVTRLATLAAPSGIISLDEHYYVPDAVSVLHHGTESDSRESTASAVIHPPVGKWFIAAGMKLFGVDSSFGWRFFGALLGALGVLLVYLIGIELWHSVFYAAIASSFLAVEGLWFVLSRVAMLDIYAAFFVVLGVWFLVRGTSVEARHRLLWSIGAASALAIAVSVKWTAIPDLLLVAAFTIGSHRSSPGPNPRSPRRVSETFATTVAFIALPLVVYAGSYLPWFIDEHRYVPPTCVQAQGVVAKWTCIQWGDFQSQRRIGLTTSGRQHLYQSDSWTWPWMGRPVAHYGKTFRQTPTQVAEVLALPNPLIWPISFLAVIALFVIWIRRKGRSIEPLLLALVAANYVPYLFASAYGRQTFLYYGVMLSPWLVLSLTHVLWRLDSARMRRGAVAMLIAATGLFAFLYPVYTAMKIPQDGWTGWQGRMWLVADCAAPTFRKSFCWS